MKKRREGGGDEKEGSGRQIPMSINMPQLIFQRAESAPPLPSQMSQAALSGGQSLGEGGLLLGGGGGGGGIPGFPPPCMKPWCVCVCVRACQFHILHQILCVCVVV